MKDVQQKTCSAGGADGVYYVIKEKPIFGKEFYKQSNYCKAW